MSLPAIKFEWSRWHTWFGFWKATPQVRDLADIIIFVFKLQISIWYPSNPWKPRDCDQCNHGVRFNKNTRQLQPCEFCFIGARVRRTYNYEQQC